MTELPSIWGTVPGWITSAGVVTLLGILLRWQLGLRKLNIEAAQVQVNAKGIANADEADLRDHYAEEVAALRKRLDEQGDRHRRLLEDADIRHEECITARDELRDGIRKLKDEVAGLKRQLARYSAESVLYLRDEPPSEVVTKAAERVISKIDKQEREE